MSRKPLYFRALLFAVFITISTGALGQTLPAATQTQSTPSPSPTPSLEKKFFVNILRDRRDIWTSPFSVKKGDTQWLAPLGLSTAV